MDPKAHCEKVYRTKQPTEFSWYRPHLNVSLQLIEEGAPNREAHIIAEKLSYELPVGLAESL